MPVLFLVFNRPDTTAKVLKAIGRAKPAYLYVAADGPRANNADDVEKCNVTQNLIINSINWDCEVKTLFRQQNLGCKKAVSAAITWFFEHVEQGIILEDDTVPNSSFFSYAVNALNRYKEKQQVMHVTGVNLSAAREPGMHKQFFSKYPQVWGWATWKRAWKNYDVCMTDWPDFKNSTQFKNWCMHQTEQAYWTAIFDAVYSGAIDTWDYQWIYAMIKNNGLSLVPAKNLVTNIGFHAEATHTKLFDPRFANLPVDKYCDETDGVLKLRADKKADKWIFSYLYYRSKEGNTSVSLIKIKDKIKNLRRTLGI